MPYTESNAFVTNYVITWIGSIPKYVQANFLEQSPSKSQSEKKNTIFRNFEEWKYRKNVTFQQPSMWILLSVSFN